MRLDDDAYDDCVRALYAAAGGLGEWRDAMDRIGTALDLWGVQLLGIDPQEQSLVYSHEGGSAPPQAMLEYLRHWHHRNPRVPRLMLAGVGDWVHDHEVFDEAFIAREPFFQEFTLPFGGRWASATKLVQDDESLVVFAAMRGDGAPPLGAPEMRMLDRLRVHLAEAVRISRRLGAARRDGGLPEQLIAHLPQPVLLVDDERRIRASNGPAREALAEGVLLVERHGHLAPVDADCERDFVLALRRLGLRDHLESRGARQERALVELRRAGSRGGSGGGVAALTALRPSALMRAFGGEPLALVTLVDPSRTRRPDPYLLSVVYGLTPAESRVAACLCEGMTPEETAARHGTSIHTVRTQIRSVLHKTASARQSELVARLASLGVAVADGAALAAR